MPAKKSAGTKAPRSKKAAKAAAAKPEQTPHAAEAVPARPKPRRNKARAETPPAVKKLSALDAAARVLGEDGRPMTCKEMVGAMAARGYWSSPGGKTPDATLYAAILREIAAKGKDARFYKADRGQFALVSNK